MPELPTIDDIKELREHYDVGTPIRRICDYLIALDIALFSAVDEVTTNGNED